MENINREEGISKNNTMLLLSAGAVYVVITTCIKRHSYNTTKKTPNYCLVFYTLLEKTSTID